MLVLPDKQDKLQEFKELDNAQQTFFEDLWIEQADKVNQ